MIIRKLIFVRQDESRYRKGKSVWRGRDGEQVNVEALALQHYEKLGYKGSDYSCLS